VYAAPALPSSTAAATAAVTAERSAGSAHVCASVVDMGPVSASESDGSEQDGEDDDEEDQDDDDDDDDDQDAEAEEEDDDDDVDAEDPPSAKRPKIMCFRVPTTVPGASRSQSTTGRGRK
jgi:hypothetical protein